MALVLGKILKANMLASSELKGTSLSYNTVDKSINDAEGRLIKAGFRPGINAVTTNSTTGANDASNLVVSVTATKMILTDAINTSEAFVAATTVVQANEGSFGDLITGGELQLRTGPPSGDPDGAANGILLVTITPITINEVLDGVLSKDSDQTWSADAVAAGTIGHFRFVGVEASVRCEGNAGTSGATLELNSVTTVVGKPVTVDTCAFSV